MKVNNYYIVYSNDDQHNEHINDSLSVCVTKANVRYMYGRGNKLSVVHAYKNDVKKNLKGYYNICNILGKNDYDLSDPNIYNDLDIPYPKLIDCVTGNYLSLIEFLINNNIDTNLHTVTIYAIENNDVSLLKYSTEKGCKIR